MASRRRAASRHLTPLPRASCLALAAAIAPLAQAAPCTDEGLSPASRMVVELREAAQAPRDAEVWRSGDGAFWFLPLPPDAGAAAGVATCEQEGMVIRRVAATGDAVSYDAVTGVLTFIDRNNPNYVLDLRKRNLAPSGPLLDALGVNYQVNAALTSHQASPSALTEIFGYRAGWYAATTLGFAPGKTNRFDSYALRENVATSVSLRLGDSATGLTVQGESLRFGGVSWGTDTTLQPSDFSPVLPDLRGGNVVPGPMDLFINDALQFQQTLRSGVYDLRNIPALQGFNSYRVRTTDALGNSVTVVRDLYIPSTLLPPGIATWRIDAGWRRQNYFTSNFDYGRPLVSGSWARGLDYDSTTSAFALLSRDASTASIGYDRRLGDLWAGHASVHAARTGSVNGWAWRLRVEGGARRWRALAETLVSPGGMPGLDATRGALLSQQFIRAQWTGWSAVTPGLTVVRSDHAGEGVQQIVTAFATLRPFDSSASLTLSVSKLRSGTLNQKSALLALNMPLEPRSARWRDNLSASANTTDGATATRLQYSASAIDGSSSQWTAAVNHDTRNGKESIDGGWSGQTSVFELAASGRASGDDRQLQLSARSAMLWTQGAAFFTRPVGGAFALVNAGEPGVTIYHENRPVAKTNAQGIALVPGLRPLESNGLAVNPLDWPIEWSATEVSRKVVAPRGGGVLVSFRINRDSWPDQGIVQPLDEAGEPYPAGTEVHATVESQLLTGIVNSKGMVWLGELVPATRFTVRHGDIECEYPMPQMNGPPGPAPLRPLQCGRRL